MGYQRIGKTLTKETWDDNFDALELLHVLQGGRGVLAGLTIADNGGLEIEISAGALLGQKAVLFDDPILFTVPDDDVKYVWVNEDGTVITTATADDPGGSNVCLGKVATSSGEIDDILPDGRVDLLRWNDLRFAEIGQLALQIDLINQWISTNTLTLVDRADTPAEDTSGIRMYSRGDSLYGLLSDGTEVKIIDFATGAIPMPSHHLSHEFGGSDYLRGVRHRLALVAATTTVTASVVGTSETALFSVTIPGGTVIASSSLLLAAAMRMTRTGSGPSIRLRVRVGGVSGSILADSGVNTTGIGAETDVAILLSAIGACRTGGSSGDMMWHQYLMWPKTGVASLTSDMQDPGGNTGNVLGPTAVVGSINWGNAQDLVITAEWSANTSGNSVSIENGILEIVLPT